MRNSFENIGLMLLVAFLGIIVVSCDTTESSPVVVNDDGDDDDDPGGDETASMIIDHTCCDISAVPKSAIQDAIDNLHICYGHTSHGSQLTTGMDNLALFSGMTSSTTVTVEPAEHSTCMTTDSAHTALLILAPPMEVPGRPLPGRTLRTIRMSMS